MKRSIHSGSQHARGDPEYLGKYGRDYLPVTRRSNLRRCMQEAVRELEDMEVDGAYFSEEDDASVLSLEDWKEAELLKWDDLEVTSICTSTTADLDSTSSISLSELPPCSSLDACREAASFASEASVAPGLSPWQAALLRAERSAADYALQHAPATDATRRRRRRERGQKKEEKTDMQKLADELRSKYQVTLRHLPSSPATPFEKLRWQFFKQHAHAICHPLSSCYLGTGKQWHLKAAPVTQAVEALWDSKRCS